jgi:pimeloyl-ACP methyl ester carboxylesterase/class 3 adenylate cyclase
VRIAYATAGSGPPLVRVGTWLTHLEYDWRSKVWQHWLEELARDHLLVRYDERGNGLSDRDVDDLSLESWLGDLEAVVDAIGLEQFALLGMSQGGPIAAAYAVRHPERVSQLVLHGTYTCGWAVSQHWHRSTEEIEALLTLTKRGWGRDDPTYRQIFTSGFIPGASAEQARWFNDLERMSATAEGAARLIVVFGNLDVRELLPRVTVPTIVFHPRGDAMIPFAEGREVAALIPNARFIPLESRNHLLLADEPAWQVFLTELRRFLGTAVREKSGVVAAKDADRSGTTVILFADIVDSTALTEQMGDAAFRAKARELDVVLRRIVSEAGGTTVEGKLLGDGVLATFPAASQAIDAALRCGIAGAGGGLPLHLGLHAGDVIREDGNVFGGAVNIASRISGLSAPGEVLVSDIVRGLARTSAGVVFEDRGEFALKGVGDAVRVYAVRRQP